MFYNKNNIPNIYFTMTYVMCQQMAIRCYSPNSNFILQYLHTIQNTKLSFSLENKIHKTHHVQFHLNDFDETMTVTK